MWIGNWDELYNGTQSIKKLVQLSCGVVNSQNMHRIVEYIVEDKVIADNQPPGLFTKLWLALTKKWEFGKLQISSLNAFDQPSCSSGIVACYIPPNGDQVFVGLRGADKTTHQITIIRNVAVGLPRSLLGSTYRKLLPE